MKKSYILIGIAVILIILALFNLSLTIDNKGHYFGNGILCGIGLSILANQIAKFSRQKSKE